MAGKDDKAQALGVVDGLNKRIDKLETLVGELTTLMAAQAQTAMPAHAKAGRATKGKQGKTKAQKANVARTEANKAAGRMSTAKYACKADSCTFASYNEAPAQAHGLKDGHETYTL